MKILKALKSDLPSSIVVFLMALPLSLGVALASGAPIKAGLIATIIGGITVGLLGGAPLQVSGPAAGLSVIVMGFIQKFGYETTCLITLLAGLFQMVLGFLGIGQITLAISPSVIEAMLAGIGILITLSQSFVLLGTTAQGNPLKILAQLPAALQNANLQALTLGLLTLGVLYFYQKYWGARYRFLPGSLMAVLFGTVVAQVFSLEVPRVNVDPQPFNSLALPKLGLNPLSETLISALALTIVASAECLLCSVATDKLHAGPRAHLNRELFGQGAANILCGLFGGLPITGVIVRSSANISAGAKSKLSTILHGFWLLLFTSLFAMFLNNIPLTVLAALLISTGIRLIKLQEIKKLMEFNEAVIYFVTLSGVIFLNLLWGIGLGFGLALLFLILRMSHFEIHTKMDSSPRQVVLAGSLTFLGIPSLTRQLDSLPRGETIKLLFDLDHIDHASIEAIRIWKENYEKTGGRIIKAPLEQLWKELAMEKSNAVITLTSLDNLGREINQ